MLGFGLGLNKWRRIGGGFVGLLDLFPNAAAAYSLRKLRAAYTGAAVRVRESGGNTEADIGFTSAGELDTSALLAHCGANDGFVTTWYDQSLSNDATQSTAANQPKIVSGGSLVTENGKAAVDFDGVDDGFIISLTQSASDYSLHAVTKNLSVNSFLFDALTGRLIFDGRGGTRGVYFDGAWKGTMHSGTNQQLQSVYAISPNSGQSYVDGVQINTGLSYTQKAIAGTTTLGSGGGFFMNGSIQEFILFASDQSSNRTGIETNINTFYSIYP